MGQIWTGVTCSGNSNEYRYDQAMALTSNFADYNDWRLPSKDELESILEKEENDEKFYINKIIFPNVQAYPKTEHQFWSSTSNPNSEFAMVIYVKKFYFGGIEFYERKSNVFSVRLVRGRQWTLGSLPLLTESQNKQFAEQEAKEIALKAEQEREEVARRNKEENERKAKYQKFRKYIKEGDDTTDGVVIEVKGSLVKIQTNDSQCTQRDYDGGCRNYVNTPIEKWFKKSEIYPRD